MEEEIWKELAKYKGYFVSNLGNIKDRNGKQITGYITKAGKLKKSSYKMIYLPIYKKYYLLHRIVADTFISNPENKPFVDHIDGDSLNNHYENLRWCTNSENSQNRCKDLDSLSKYKGVYKGKINSNGKQMWRTSIKINQKSTFLGVFESEIEAARAYNEKAFELFGEFAKLNII